MKLVEAFNKSEIGKVNPNLEILVDNIILTLDEAQGKKSKNKKSKNRSMK